MRALALLLTLAACDARVPLTPAPSATPAARATPKVLYFLPFTATARAGGAATVVIQTDPGARCTIAASYLSIVEASPLLGPTVADRDGRASWTWTVDARAPSGSWPIVVVCDGAEARTHLPVEALPGTSR